LLNLGPDSITKVYRHVPLELTQRLKAAAKRHSLVSVKLCPMPKSRDTFRVMVKASGHSWVASSQIHADLWADLTPNDRVSLSCLKD